MATATEAVEEMNRHGVGSVVVMDADQIVGIFTERDVLKRVVGCGLDPKTVRMPDVMTPNPVTVGLDITAQATMELFNEKHCRHLPVLAQGRLVGLISIGDISRWMSDVHRTECEHLKNYISGGFVA